MNVGKAIYYLLANNANVSAITTRIYPEFAPPDATTPFIAYTITNVQPDDTHDGPAVIDEVRMDVICVDDTYDGAADLASVVRVALDRVYGTYNTVNVESIQFTDANIEVRDTPRQYGQDLTFIVRVKRDDVQIATGSPIEALNLWRLADVDDEIVNALDRQALVYDEATSQWIADGVGQVVIPVRNPSRDDSIAVGTVLKATGAQGDRVLVAPFNIGDDPKLLVGVASEVLGNTDATKDGHAQVYGELRNVNTNLYPVGTVLYAGDSGALSTTVSEHPIAIVTRQHENTGRIFIRTWIPGRSRYNSEVETLRAEMEASLASADVELMFSAQADGFGVAYSPESDSVVNSTPPEDYQVERAIFYNNTGLASYVSDSGWSTLTTNVESYAAAKARVEDYIRGGTYGKLPCTFAIVRTEELKYVGLLDTYTGAVAAYSLRWLNTDYTGSAIRVRRASDNAEQDIGFLADGYLDTTALATFCSGTDGFVKTWYDQANSNAHLQQTDTARQGIIVSSGTVLIDGDGLPYVNAIVSTYYNPIQINQPFTAFAVAQFGAGFRRLMLGGVLWSPDLTNNRFNAGLQLTGTNALNFANKELYGVLANGASSEMRYNGITDATGNVGTNGITSATIFSQAAPSNTGPERAYEMVIFSGSQSGNFTGIESNMNTYYSIYP